MTKVITPSSDPPLSLDTEPLGGHLLIAITGPQGSGKSTLALGLSRLLASSPQQTSEAVEGTKLSKGAAKNSNSECRFEALSGTRIIGCSPSLTLADCPGHPEQLEETLAWASCADLTLVVTGPQPENLVRAAPLLDQLAAQGRPHAVVINQILEPTFNADVMIPRISRLCRERVLAQQVPLHRDNTLIGLVQLYNESATLYLGSGKGEKTVPLPPEAAWQEARARQEFLESLADFDDRLLVDLLEERLPSLKLIASDLRAALQHDDIVPLYMADAREGLGMSHLAQALLQFAAPQWMARLASLSEPKAGSALAVVVQPGEIIRRGPGAICYLLRGNLSAGESLAGQRLGHLYLPTRDATWSELADGQAIKTGQVFMVPRLDGAFRSHLLGGSEPEGKLAFLSSAEACYPQSLVPEAKTTWPEKLIQSLDRLARECPPIQRSFSETEPRELVLWTTGPQQLDMLQQQLRERFGFTVVFRDPLVPMRERMLRPATRVQGRYKHQNGGHGAFGDVFIDFEPLAPGSGFVFEDAVTGGAVPRAYIAAVEEGLREALQRGPQGYPVTDLKACLVDGSTHAVDSSYMAFKQAARLSFQHYIEQVPSALLEPMVNVRSLVPEGFSNALLQLPPAYRGHVLEFVSADTGPSAGGRPGWNLVVFALPQVHVPELVRAARSQTQGLAELAIELPDDRNRYRVKD